MTDVNEDINEGTVNEAVSGDGLVNEGVIYEVGG